MKPRMSSFVDRGNALIAKGKTPEAIKLVERGLQYYTERVVKSLSPYAKSDAGLISLVLRHIADEIEKNNSGAKGLREGLEEMTTTPPLIEKEKVQKANRR